MERETIWNRAPGQTPSFATGCGEISAEGGFAAGHLLDRRLAGDIACRRGSTPSGKGR